MQLQFLIVNQQSLQNSLYASVGHLLLVVAAQKILLACLEHHNLQKITPRWSLNMCTWHDLLLKLGFPIKSNEQMWLNFADFLAVFGCHHADVWEQSLHLRAALKQGWFAVSNLQGRLLHIPKVANRDSVEFKATYLVRKRRNLAPGAAYQTDPLLSWKRVTNYQSAFPTRVQTSTIWVTTVQKHQVVVLKVN